MADRLAPPRGTPLVGREAELGRLQVALDQAMAQRGALVLVSGEPGIGKTRLVEELATRASEGGALVVWGRVDEEEGAPAYWPWVQLLGAVFDDCDGDVVSGALEPNAGVIAAIVPEAKEFVADVVPPPLLGPAEARFRLHQSVVDFLDRISRHQRLVVVLEDLHWADVASLELTRFMAARLATVPVLLIVTYRSVDAGGSAAFDDVRASLARQTRERITLTGLTEPEVGRFIAQTVDFEPTAATVSAVHARTEGNPFFVAELARLLESEGPLVGGPSGSQHHRGVPTGVRDVVRRRLRRLLAPTGELLALGAVIGRDFGLAVLSAAAELPELDTLDRIGPAIVAGLVLEDPDSVGRFRFSHALVRDTAYAELTASRRATLHARVGAALEQQGHVRSDVAELAWHFFHAAPVAGPERGLVYTLRAAEAARATMAYERAENDLHRALTLIEMMPAGTHRLEQELHVQNRLAALLTITNGPADPEVGRICARARALAQQVGQADELIATIAGLAYFHLQHADFTIVLELAEQLLAIGQRHSNPMALAIGHTCKGVVLPYFDALGEGRANLATALSLARTFERTAQIAEAFRIHPLVVILAGQARCEWLAGDEAGALAATEEVVLVGRQLGHVYSLSFALYTAALMAVLTEDASSAGRWAEEALAACSAGGLVLLETTCRLFHGWAKAQLGRPGEGVAEMKAALAVLYTTGSRMNTALFLGLLADGEGRLGNGDRALALIDEALGVAQALPDRVYEADIHRRRGELLASLGPGRVDEAAASLREALSIAEAQGAVAFQRRAQAALVLLDEHARASASAHGGDLPAVSPRERELLGLVGRGLTDKQIASELTISVATVRSHLDRIRDKTGRRRRPELTRLAVDLGIIDD